MWEKFRNNDSQNYGLCPSHYLSAPALSWDVMLNITKVKRELISDADMYLFFEKGMTSFGSWWNFEKILLHNENLELYLRLGLKFKQSQWLKSYVEFKTQKRIEAEKNGGKDRKAYMVKQWKNWEKELM